MIDDINDTCKVFAHICFYVVRFSKKLRNAVVQVSSDNLVDPSLFVVFVKFVQTVCKQTVGGTDNTRLA